MRAIVLSAVIFGMLHPAHAGELPLWEAGVGFSGLSMPDYRGSRDRREYLFPLPYAVYRGDLIRFDRKGLSGLLFDSDRLQFNVSADANVPVNSDRSTARPGMPDRDATVQFGPAVEYCISGACGEDRVVQVRLPVRAAFTISPRKVAEIGVVANPQVSMDLHGTEPLHGWSLGFAAGPLFASRRYHRYYYGVPSELASQGRAAYDAPGGYSGFMLVLSLSKRFEQAWMGLFCKYDELSGAVFESSPLVQVNRSLMAGFGIAWIGERSPVLVQTRH